MAKKKPTTPPRAMTVTGDRAARLFRLLTILGHGPQTRTMLTRKLKLGIRGFYRDLEVLREIGIRVELDDGRYLLTENSEVAIKRLPFPDPALTLGEARDLSKGNTAAHKKIRKQIDAIVK